MYPSSQTQFIFGDSPKLTLCFSKLHFVHEKGSDKNNNSQFSLKYNKKLLNE